MLARMEALLVELLGIEREFASGRAQAGGIRRRRALVDRLFENHIRLRNMTGVPEPVSAVPPPAGRARR
jgi:hypothetical protein